MADSKKDKDFTRCINCANATFMQWMKNPVIAYCRITDERQVAEAKRLCKEFKLSNKEPQVTHYKSYQEGPES